MNQTFDLNEALEQIKANTDTKGIDVKIAPINELLFESSDIPTIKIAEIKTFIM